MKRSSLPPLAGHRLEARSIQHQVTAQLRQMIISGELAPGAGVSETALAEAFGVSRTPVREALKQLEVEGLVTIAPRVGTSVTVPSRRSIGELFLVKEVLEGLAARLLALRGHVDELEALVANVEGSERAVAGETVEGYAELVHEFHDLILAGADNGKLHQHYRTLMNQLAYPRLVKTSLAQPDRPRESVREHRAVLELILAKDGDGAERAMRDHVRTSHRVLMEGLELPPTPEENRQC
ncbi:MAG: hypothetical protein QOH46_3657 [Solirubrobacteraceae bacterium]|jgi:DNA-binding GntR family transcriptional regulator|nr:hypothetical protein [Solirubrobacteraceae bacterium]